MRSIGSISFPLAVMSMLAWAPIRAYAQGCSDAGICTAGPLGDITLMGEDGAVGTDMRNDARILFGYAIGEQGTQIMQVAPEVTLNLNQRIRFSVRVPILSITGNLGSNAGFGDPLFMGSYAFVKDGTQRLDGLLGFKLNSGKATSTNSALQPLPMPYQTSLGTKDLLLGLNYRKQHFTAAIAYQRVLVDENRNEFIHELWQDIAEAQGYFESGGLMRADDAVVRIQYALKFSRLVIQPGLLAIYHVAEDEREVFKAQFPEVIKVDGSEGITVNITADARYPLGENWSLEAAFGSPLIIREARPDGLTRSLVLNVGLRYAF